MIGFPFAAAALCLATGVVLKGSSANQTLFLAINARSSDFPAPFWAGMTNLGSTLAAAALLLAFAWCSRQPLRLAALALLPTTLFVHGLKRLINEPRPVAVLDPDLFVVIDKSLRSGAFPSGHTATAVVVTSAIITTLWPLTRTRPLLAWAGIAAATLYTLLVALSRIAVGAHWPSDLLAGCGAGLAGMTAAIWLARQIPPSALVRADRWFLLAAVVATLALPFDRGLYPSGMASVWGVVAAALIGGALALWKAWRETPPLAAPSTIK